MARYNTPPQNPYPNPYDPYGSQQGGSPYGSYPEAPYSDATPHGQEPSPYGGYADAGAGQASGDPYRGEAAGASPYGRRAQQQDAYGQADPGRSARRPRQADPYGAQNPGRGQRTRSPYSQAFDDAGVRTQGSPYGRAQRAAGGQQRAAYGQPSAGQQAGGPAASPTAYPAGSGQVYEPSSWAANKAAGVKPVEAGDYLRTPYSSDLRDRHGSKGPLLSRRGFLAAAGGAAVAALALGFVGVNWYTHRAVACTIDGTPREAPVGSSAADLVERGYASPRAGDLVSIAQEGEAPTVLQQGGGEPYTLTVNGQPQNPETWRLAEGDDVAFSNGSNVTEPVNVQTTEIPCGIQIPEDQYLLTPLGFVQQWGRVGVSTVETGQVSGRTINRGVTQEPQDLIIACNTHINPEGGLKVALTFDDGPSLEYTPQYLDILARYGAKATFFNLGTQLVGGPEYEAMARRCAEEGHQVASHTYSHSDVTLTNMSVETRNDEISKTFQLVSNATGVLTEVMRPPYGEFRGKGFLQYLASGGNIAYSAYWSVDSLDWERPGADAIVANCTRGLSGDNYNGAVILMHDGGGDRSQDVQALPRIIETFQNAGYELVTMNELLKADPTYPEWVWSGYVQRPEGAIVPDTTGYV